MHKIILHLKVWNIWRKYYLGSRFKKLLVLLGLLDSPSMLFVYYQVGVEDGLKHQKITIRKMRTKKLLKKTDIDKIDNFLNEDITIKPYSGGNNDV